MDTLFVILSADKDLCCLFFCLLIKTLFVLIFGQNLCLYPCVFFSPLPMVNAASHVLCLFAHFSISRFRS